jgi:hypothetical protein
VTRRQRLLVGIVAAVIVMVISFLGLANQLSLGRMAWTPLAVFVLAAMGLIRFLRRLSLPPPTVGVSNWFRLRLGAVLFLVFGALLDLFLIAFGVAEAVGPHHYAWLLVVPIGVWGLTKMLPAIGKVWRADPTELDRRG